MPAIETVNLSKRYGRVTAVEALDLRVEKGEVFSLLGVNGAGKTTTIKMLSCLAAPSGGDAFVDGHSIVRDRAGVKGAIGISPQETAIAPNLSARENLELMCALHALRRPKRREQVEKLAAQFGLEEVLGRRAGKLSGGWQRRLSIAMALVGEPNILFLDEPMLGLDVLARSELRASIRALRGGVTVVVTTHDMQEAEALSDRIGVMRSGRLLAVGTARELKQRTGTQSLEEAFVSLVKGEIA